MAGKIKGLQIKDLKKLKEGSSIITSSTQKDCFSLAYKAGVEISTKITRVLDNGSSVAEMATKVTMVCNQWMCPSE